MLMVVFCLWWAAGLFGKQKDSGAFLTRPVPFIIEVLEPQYDVYDSIPATEDELLGREAYLQAYINKTGALNAISGIRNLVSGIRHLFAVC
jgi:hypothetical protein